MLASGVANDVPLPLWSAPLVALTYSTLMGRAGIVVSSSTATLPPAPRTVCACTAPAASASSSTADTQRTDRPRTRGVRERVPPFAPSRSNASLLVRCMVWRPPQRPALADPVTL